MSKTTLFKLCVKTKIQISFLKLWPVKDFLFNFQVQSEQAQQQAQAAQQVQVQQVQVQNNQQVNVTSFPINILGVDMQLEPCCITSSTLHFVDVLHILVGIKKTFVNQFFLLLIIKMLSTYIPLKELLNKVKEIDPQ